MSFRQTLQKTRNVFGVFYGRPLLKLGSIQRFTVDGLVSREVRASVHPGVHDTRRLYLLCSSFVQIENSCCNATTDLRSRITAVIAMIDDTALPGQVLNNFVLFINLLSKKTMGTSTAFIIKLHQVLKRVRWRSEKYGDVKESIKYKKGESAEDMRKFLSFSPYRTIIGHCISSRPETLDPSKSISTWAQQDTKLKAQRRHYLLDPSK